MAVSKKLLFLPDWSGSNPYQKLLYDALQVAGVTCSGMQGSEFTFRWLWSNRSTYKYIHFHWLFGIYDPENTGLTVKKAGIFLAKIIFARILGYKVIWTVHNIVSHEPTNIKRELALRKFTSWMVNHVIVHCNYAKEKILSDWKLNKNKVTVIPHGSYLGHYPNEITRRDARQKLSINSDSFTFLFFGMLRNYKGIKQLVASFKKLKQQLPEIRLLVAGSPFNNVIQGEIETLAQTEGISLYLRYIPDDEVQIFFNASDVIVLPYQNILTSGGVILALSFGKPVIVPAIGCIPELINDEIGFTYVDKAELFSAMRNAAIKTDIGIMDSKSMIKAKALTWDKIVSAYYLKLFTHSGNQTFRVKEDS